MGNSEHDKVRYHVIHDQATASLILAEAELTAGNQLAQAARQLNSAAEKIGRINYAREISHLKVPEPASLAKRLENARKRLQECDPPSAYSR